MPGLFGKSEIVTIIPDEMRYLDVNALFEEHGYRNMTNVTAVSDVISHLCSGASSAILVIVDATDEKVANEPIDFIRVLARRMLIAKILPHKAAKAALAAQIAAAGGEQALAAAAAAAPSAAPPAPHVLAFHEDFMVVDERELERSMNKVIAEVKRRQCLVDAYQRWVGPESVPPSVSLAGANRGAAIPTLAPPPAGPAAVTSKAVAAGVASASAAAAAVVPATGSDGDARRISLTLPRVQATAEDDKWNWQGPFVGRGSLGDVFQSCCDLIGKPMAVKVIDTSKLSPTVVAAIDAEIALVKSLGASAHLVRYYFDVTVDGPLPPSPCVDPAGSSARRDGFGATAVHGGGSSSAAAVHKKIYMELCKTSTQSILNTVGQFPDNMVRLCAKHILHGLEFLHKAFVVHRDVKPDNVLVSFDGIYKLADFSSAIELPVISSGSIGSSNGGDFATNNNNGVSSGSTSDLSGASPLVRRGKINGDNNGSASAATAAAAPAAANPGGSSNTNNNTAGTIQFMAPEVFNGKEYDTSADIWSFGVLIMALMRALPRDGGMAADLLPSFFNVEKPDDLSPVMLPLTMSKDAQSFLSQCLQRDPSKRATAEQLLQHAFLQNEKGAFGAAATKTVSQYASQSMRSKMPAVMQLVGSGGTGAGVLVGSGGNVGGVMGCSASRSDVLSFAFAGGGGGWS